MPHIYARPFEGPADFESMRRVLLDGRRERLHSTYIHIGDLSWWLFFLLRDVPPGQIAYLWEDVEGGVLGWTLLSPQRAALDLFARPEWREGATLDTMLAWSEAQLVDRLRGQGSAHIVTMWVFEDDAVWRMALARRGYRPVSDGGLFYLQHALDSVDASRLPDGYHLGHVTDDLVPARVAAHRAAFGSERLTVEAYHQLRGAPDYRPEMDVVAIAPGGRVASYAQGWYDAENCVGEFEPVGTAPEFQRQGIGRAMILEGMRRLRALGAREAIVYVEHDNPAALALYRSVGLRSINRIYTYRKSLGGQVGSEC